MRVVPDPRMGLRALTVRQPYAGEILAGSKREEYRSWSTAYRGDLLITASANPRTQGPYGCTFCVVRLAAVEGLNDDWTWFLEDPRPVTQKPVLGKLKLWTVSAELVKQLGLTVR